MKYLPEVLVTGAVLILLFNIYNVVTERKTVEQQGARATEVSFKLGVAYGEEARADARYADCHTVGELADLAWQLYSEENQHE